MKTDQDTFFPKNVRGESATVSLRIGDCLLKEGFVTEDEIARALEIQQKEEKQLKFSKECVIPDLAAMSKKDLRLLLQQPPLDTNLGLICLQKGLLDKKTLYDVLKDKPDGSMLGEALIKEGYLTAGSLEDILLEHLGMDKFCEVLEDAGLLTSDESRKARFTRKSPKTLGQILCDMGVINPADLDYVLKKYGKQIKFGEILVKEGIINHVKLMSALQDQFHKEEPLGKILLGKNLITMDQLYQALSVQHNIPYQKITQLNLTETQRQVLTNIVSRKYAQKNMVLPLALNGNQITVAVSDPEHLAAANDIKNVYSHLTVSPLFISQDNFIRLFEEIYQSGMDDILRVEAGKDKSPININALDINLSTTGIDDTESRDKADYYGVTTLEGQELVNYLIKYGIANGASDIHVEQDRKQPKVRYRIDGILHTLQMKWLDEKLDDLINAVISRIKVISGLDIAERRLPQDGVFRVNYYDPRQKENVDLDFRVATCPGIVGENVTIRILDPRKAKVDIDKLGHSPDVVAPFKGFLKSAGGMILVSGPTGSGKTSTLYSALQYIYDPTIKIITAEDPIEYSFPGIMQTQVNPKINLSFARLLRSFLRLDPDAILVGEIRDQETARISFDASQTGHLMLSTVHTNDSVSAITRLVDLGIDYNQIASGLMCVVAQRLLRKNCTACSVPYTPTEEEWAPLFTSPPDHLHFFHGEGCAQCGYSGYQGRTLISELFIITPEIARALNRETSLREIKKIAINKGMKTMIEDGLSKIHDTTLSELIRVVPNEMLKEFRAKDKATTSLKDGSA